MPADRGRAKLDTEFEQFALNAGLQGGLTRLVRRIGGGFVTLLGHQNRHRRWIQSLCDVPFEGRGRFDEY